MGWKKAITFLSGVCYGLWLLRWRVSLIWGGVNKIKEKGSRI
jgi:hypothetical protein